MLPRGGHPLRHAARGRRRGDRVTSTPSGVQRLDPSRPEQVRAIAAMHAELLPDSPLSELGTAFMERFYYSTLVRDGLVQCELYWHEGRAVAFSSWTERPFTFMREGLQRHFAFLCLLTAATLAARPSRIGTLRELQQTAPQRSAPPRPGIGEMLSFAVRADAASLRDPATGKKVTHLLVDRVIEHLRSRGYQELQMMIRKDNRPSLLFFNSYGGVIGEAAFVPASSYLVTVPLS